jgi:hypothetical protein
VAFFALDREANGTVPIYERQEAKGTIALSLTPPSKASSDARPQPVFYALPGNAAKPPPATVPLYEFTHQDNTKRTYSTSVSPPTPNHRRADRPLCLVWKHPTRMTRLPDKESDKHQ